MTRRGRHLISLLAATSLLLLSLPWPEPTYAATFNVNTITDEAQNGAPTTNCANTVSHNCSLRSAIQAANAFATGPLGTQHVINLTVPGTYQLTVTGAGEDNAATGDLDLNNTNVLIQNTSGGAVSINGNATDRVFDVGPTSPAALTISTAASGPAITIANGNIGQSGGGIFNEAFSSLTLTNVTVSGNQAPGALGGGLRNDGTATLTGVTLSGNSAGEGAGIENAGPLTLTNVTISGNTASLSAGGIEQAGNTITATNVTIAANSSAAGAQAIHGGGAANPMQLRNSIVQSNTPASNCSGAGITSLGNNIDNGNSCGFSAAGDLSNTNPNLAALAVNPPGVTATHALNTGSPAINGGTNVGCPATDQRGVTRPQGPLCDIGAYEAPVVAATFNVTTLTDAPHSNPVNANCTSTLSGNPCTLRAAIQAANFLSGGAGGTQHVINLTVPGTYQLTVTGAGEDNAATGDLDLNNTNVLIQNTSGGAVSINGNGTDRVFDVGPITTAALTISTAASGPAITITNGASGQQGGGLFNHNGSTLTLTNVTVSGNQAPASLGGGLRNTGTATLSGVTFSGNTAGEGAGISNTGPLTLTNATISGNTAVNGAGGIEQGGNTLTATNVTIAFNSSTSGTQAIVGGGAANPFQLRNSIVHSNTPASNCSGGGITSQGNNIDNGNSCGFSAAGDLPNTNPNLAALAVNAPGVNATHALNAGSPAIDGGTNTGCPSTDERGVARPQGVRCDIGAYEAQVVAPTPTPTPPTTCAPRPPVSVVVSPTTGHRVQVTVTAGTNASTPTNNLSQLQFVTSTHIASPNALILPYNATVPFTTPAINAPSTTFFLQQQNSSQPVTVALNVVDACGSWSTFVGGGLAVFGTPGPAPAQPTAAPPAAATAPATAAPSGAAGGAPRCAPRPPVRVATAAAGSGRLQVTVAADSASGASLQSLAFGPTNAALVDIPGGQTGATGSFTVPLPAGTQQTTFVVRRAVEGQGATVPLVVTDSCGDWPTLIGGGASAF